MKTQKGWAIAGKYGLYYGWWFTRREAIEEHCRLVNSVWTWEELKKMGDRPVKVKITYDNNRKPRKSKS